MTNPLPPTQRMRNRYIAFSLEAAKPVDRRAVGCAVWDSMLFLYGVLGASESALWLMDWDKKKQKGILKCSHKEVEKVRAALCFVSEAGGVPCRPRVLGVSGTLKKTRGRWLN